VRRALPDCGRVQVEEVVEPVGLQVLYDHYVAAGGQNLRAQVQIMHAALAEAATWTPR